MPFFVQMNPDDIVQGDTPTYEFDLSIDPTRVPSKVWMTAKQQATWSDASAYWQVIGTITGAIATTATDKTWQCLFHLNSTQSANTPLLVTGYDVQVKLDNADILTPVIGQLKAVVGYTATTV